MDDFIVKEYAVKDKDGKFKIWQEGKLVNYQQWLASKAIASTTSRLQRSQAMVDTGMEEPVLAPPAPTIYKQPPKFGLEKIITRLVEEFSLQLTQEARDRFARLLLSFFRGARTAVDLRTSLQGDWKFGDVGLKEVDMDGLLKAVKEIDKKIKENGGEVVSLQIDEKKLKDKPHIAKEIADAEVAAKNEIKDTIDKQASIIQQANAASSGGIANIGKEEKADDFVVKKQEPVEKKGMFSWHKRSHTVPAGKVAMDEVKNFTKLVGPVDELQQLDLNMFRRLGSTPTSIIDKIKERIDSLSNGSVAERDRVIKAWQASPVYGLYVRLGRASLEDGLPVDTIIKQQTNAGQPSLTVEEFDAISDLNAKFRF
ncbi:MAG: hypothetical protein ACKKL6_00635 [Candidatus Komeilibacteria bacterium]